MTHMTVLHIASPFSVSTPVPERSLAAQADRPDAVDAMPGVGTAAHAIDEGEGAASDDGSERFVPLSREAVLRRYAAFGAPDRDAGSVESGLNGLPNGAEPTEQATNEVAKILGQNQPDASRRDPDQQGSDERRP